MKKEYQEPEAVIVRLENIDIITASEGLVEGGDED